MMNLEQSSVCINRIFGDLPRNSFIFFSLVGFAVFCTQFYFIKSGFPQPGHYLLALLCVCYLTANGSKISEKCDIADWLLVLLLIYISGISIFYFIRFNEIGFLFPIAYLLYGAILFFTFKSIFSLSEAGSLIVSFYTFLALIFILLISALGIGRNDFVPRYNAFFNDPNQMAFWVLCATSILLLKFRVNLIYSLLLLIVAYILIGQTESRSGFFGYLFMVFGYCNYAFRRPLARVPIKFYGIILASTFVIILIAYFVLLQHFGSLEEIITNLQEMIFGRTGLAYRLGKTDVGLEVFRRGYIRLFQHPSYLLFGAGQALDTRFIPEGYEIHSTYAGLLFYFGVPGLVIFLCFLTCLIKKLSIENILILSAPFIYSFFTYGFRSPIFWIFLGCVYGVASSPFANGKAQL